VSVFIQLCSSVSGSYGFGYNYFSRTNTKNVTLPVSRADAELKGWILTDRKDGRNSCHNGLGVEYTEGSNTHSKFRPLSLFFEASSLGRLSALSVRAWFSNSSFYNPDTWQLPAFGVTEEAERWVTVTTRDTSTVCDPKSIITSDDAMLGDRLIVNVNSPSSIPLLSIPTTVPVEHDGPWKFGVCGADMSRHWAYPLDGNFNSLYGFDHGIHVLPIVPMYSVPDEVDAGITALAFFTTEPQVTFKNGGVWDASGTPAQLCSGNFCLDETKCEYGESNSVFHIFFVDQWSAPAQCGAGGSPGCNSPY